MSDLIERLESATEGSQGDAIRAVLDHAHEAGWINYEIYCDACEWVSLGAFLDAARILLPEGFSWLVGNGEAWVWKANSVGHNPRLRVPAWDVRTPALALCIASLKAREME